MATKKSAVKKDALKKETPKGVEESPKKLGRPVEILKLTEGEAPRDVIDFSARLVQYIGDDGKLLVAIMQYLRQQERVVGILGVVNMLRRYGA